MEAIRRYLANLPVEPRRERRVNVPRASTPVVRPPRVNASLEVLRGGAAVLVVLSHARLYPYAEADLPLAGRSSIERLLLIPTAFGREAVAVFFVLSGYLVGGQVVRQLRSRRFRSSEFLIKRLTRFWVVLLPGLVFTAGIDALSRHWFTTDHANIQGAGTTSWSEFACNAVFLMDGRCRPFGSDESLWSLGYEFWFYLVFAAAAWAAFLGLGRHGAKAALGVVVAAASVAIYGAHLLLLIPAWLMGVVISEIEPTVSSWLQARSRSALAASLALIAGGMLTATLHDQSLPAKYLLLGFATAPLVLCLAALDPDTPRWGRRPVGLGVWLGTWSFTLYVFHLPFVMFATAASANAGIEPTPPFVYLLAAFVIVAIYPAYWLGEAHTSRVREWSLARFGVVRTSVPSAAVPRGDMGSERPTGEGETESPA